MAHPIFHVNDRTGERVGNLRDFLGRDEAFKLEQIDEVIDVDLRARQLGNDVPVQLFFGHDTFLRFVL